MIRLFSSVMGSIDSSPYIPKSKCDPLTLGASLLLGGTNVFNGLLGYANQQSANAANLQAVRETNAQNYKIFQEQMAYNTDMWNKQNEYNLPKYQVQRLLDAGINPAAVFGNGSVSEAGSLTAPQAIPMQAGHVNPASLDLSGVGQAVNSYFQNELLNAEKKRTNSETAHNEFLTMEGNKKLLPTLQYLENQAKHEGVLGDIARSQLSYAQDSYYWRLKQLRNEVTAQNDQSRYMAKKTYEQELQNGLMEVQLAYQPKMNEANLRQYYLMSKQIQASTGLILANTTLTKEQALNEAQKKIGQILDNGMKGFDYKFKQETYNYSVDLFREELYKMEDERWLRPFDASYRFTGNAGQWLPNASGSWAANEMYTRNYHRDRLK